MKQNHRSWSLRLSPICGLSELIYQNPDSPIFEQIEERLTLEFYENEDESVKQNLRIYILDVLDKNVYSEIWLHDYTPKSVQTDSNNAFSCKM